MSENTVLRIDVADLIKSKNPKLAKRMPRFVISYLKRIVHQDEVNRFLYANRNNHGLDFVKAVVDYMEVQIECSGFGNIPENGRFVFAANHPLGGLESMILMEVVSKKHPNFVFVVNDILMAIKPMQELFVPVNKHGSQSRTGLEILNNSYQSDKQILFFPAGLVSRKIKGKITDLQWQKSFVAKAVETKRDIIPVYISGKNSSFFYNLAKIRKFFGIKANVEMLYLVDEMVKQKRKKIKICFGKPVSYKLFDKSRSFNQWAEYLKELTYSLK